MSGSAGPRGLVPRLGRACLRWLLRRLGATAYLEVLDAGTRDMRHRWAESFLFWGFGVGLISAVVLLAGEPAGAWLSAAAPAPGGAEALRAWIAGVAALRAGATIAFSAASALFLSAIVDVAIRVGHLMRQQDLRLALKNLCGVEVVDTAREIAVVIGDVEIVGVSGTPDPPPGGHAGAPVAAAPLVMPSVTAADYDEAPKITVARVAEDVVRSPHPQFAILGDVKAVAGLFTLFSDAALGVPPILLASDAVSRLAGPDCPVKCFISVGLFSNEFTVELARRAGRAAGTRPPLFTIARASRAEHGTSVDACAASFRTELGREEYWIHFDWDGGVVKSSDQLHGHDLGLLARTFVREPDGRFKCSVLTVGGFGAQGTLGVSEALRRIVQGRLDAAIPDGEFAMTFKVHPKPPVAIEAQRTYR